MRKGLMCVAVLFLLIVEVNGIPLMMNYQGKLEVDGTPYTGTGLFRFAIVDQTGSTTYWSNDGNPTPTTDVAVQVDNGIYNVILGSTDGMNPLPASVFENDPVFLRVWFNDGTTGTQLLAPDQRLTSVAFSMMAENVSDGAIQEAKLATDAVTSDKILNGTITGSDLQDDGVGVEDLAHNIDGAAIGLNADMVDGEHYASDWPTTLSNIQSACSNDFHQIGGTDDDGEWSDAGIYIQADNAPSVVITDAGDVGIGTTAPTQKLEVSGGVKASSFEGNGANLSDVLHELLDDPSPQLGGNLDVLSSKITTSVNSGDVTVEGGNGTNAIGGDLTLVSGGTSVWAGSGSVSKAILKGGTADGLGSGASIEAQGAVSAGSGSTNVSGGNLTLKGGIGNGSGADGGIVLQTDNISRMTLTSAGDVGIGTSAPNEKLDVNGNANVNGSLTMTTANVSVFAQLTPLSTAPTTPTKGMIYMDGTTNKLMVYDGSSWQACW